MEETATFKTKTILITGGLVLFFMLLFSAWAWFQIPPGQKMPVHWGANGEVDRYGSKFEGLFLMPIIMGALIIPLAIFIPYLEPRKQNFMQSLKVFYIIIFCVMFFMAGIHFATIMFALGYPVKIAVIVPAGVGILFIVIGNYLGKIRSNFFMGIRTPWTLSSELSWNKTHRLGGKLFVLMGIVMMAAGIFQIHILIPIISMLFCVGIMIIYSYVVWKSDPNKQTTGR